MKLLAAALGLARLALPAGVVVLAAAAWLTWRHAGGAAIPAERDLPIRGGLITALREVNAPASPGSGAATPPVVELDLQTEAGGTPVTVRVDAAIARERLTVALNRRATVRYDSTDNNRLYVLAADGAEIVSYADVARRVRSGREQAQAVRRPGAALWAAGAVLSAVGGVAGIAWRRRLRMVQVP